MRIQMIGWLFLSLFILNGCMMAPWMSGENGGHMPMMNMGSDSEGGHEHDD